MSLMKIWVCVIYVKITLVVGESFGCWGEIGEKNGR